MKSHPNDLTRTFLPLSQGFVFAIALVCAAPCTHSQVAAPDETQPGMLSVLDQASMYPVQSQTTQTPNLNSLNENADTTKYADNALTRGPFFFSVDSTGGWSTNILQTFDNRPATSGAYFDFGVPVGVHLWNSITDFTAYFKGEETYYPEHSQFNHSSQIYSQQMIHRLSDTTTVSWSLAGGHVVTLGHYLSPVIAVGNTGVLAPQEASGLQPLTDAATTFSYGHQTDELDSFLAAGTFAWLDQPTAGAGSSPSASYRQLTGGGDFQWQRALNSRQMAGIEFTNVYIAGLAPGGSGNFTSAEITFGQSLTPHSSITAGVGPLYAQASLAHQPEQDALTYSANAAIQYRRAFGHITGGFSRVYELGYLAPASTANQFSFSFDHPISSKIILTQDSQFVISHAFEGRNNYGQFVSTTRLDYYLTPTLDYHLEGSSLIQDTGAPTPGFNGNEFSTGITYYFGTPLSRSGAQ